MEIVLHSQPDVRRLVGGWLLLALALSTAFAVLLVAARTPLSGGLVAPVALSGVPADPVQFELMAWGPGHVLQFAHVLLLMGVWSGLGERALSRAVTSRSFMVGLRLLAALPVLAAPVVYVANRVDSTEFRRALTLLMAWGSWLAAVLLGGRLLLQLTRAGHAIWMALHKLPLLLSIFLFLMGCLCGAVIRGESTMVPAHYHGTVGAVTLAYMALGYRLLPAFGFVQVSGRRVRWQPVLYCIGWIILAAALAWSGWLCVPRKTLYVDIGMQYPEAVARACDVVIARWHALC